MDFGLTEEQQMIVDTTRSFVENELYPHEAEVERTGHLRMDLIREIQKKAIAAGLYAANMPEEVGGAGLDTLSWLLYEKELGRANYALHWTCVARPSNILLAGNEEQREQYLYPCIRGEKWDCLAMTEPGAGSDLRGMKASAKQDGDDWILNGRKLYITNGPVADLCLVYARTDPERGTRGITAFVVDMKASGVRVAQKLVKMGFRGSQTAELAFDDCRVPAANVLGKVNEGVKCIMSGLDLERAMISPICVGVAERALALSIAHAKARVQFGEPIANFQMIQSRLADMSTLVETMRTYNYYCLATMNDLPPGEGGRGEVHRISATSVMYCADAMNRVLDHAVQVHGGAGYVWETEMNRLYRATKLLEIGAGTTEVRKLIIAKELLA